MKMIDYTVIKRTEFLNIKVAFDIRVKGVPSKEDLKFISNDLVCREEKKYDRIFICFYLPGMEVGAGAFATVHHNPKIEVKIMDYMIPEKYKLKDVKPVAWCVKCRKEIKPRTVLLSNESSITTIECDICYSDGGE